MGGCRRVCMHSTSPDNVIICTIEHAHNKNLKVKSTCYIYCVVLLEASHIFSKKCMIPEIEILSLTLKNTQFVLIEQGWTGPMENRASAR